MEDDEFDIIDFENEEVKEAKVQTQNMNGHGLITGTINNFKNNINKVKNKVKSSMAPLRDEFEGDLSPNPKNFEIISLPKDYFTKEEEWKEEVDFHTSLSASIMQELRPSLNDKIVGDDYFTNKVKRRNKKSTSTSRLQEEEEYEEVTDLNYILTEAEWRDFLENPPKKWREIFQQRIICSIKVGLPERQRGKVWEYLVKAKKYRDKQKMTYKEYLNTPSTDNTDYTISKDILRTFPELKVHKEDIKEGENSLFNVLRSYAIYDPEVKYCQGMNFIVFLFLQNLDSNEERAFWLLVGMMKHLKWRKLYKLDTPKLMKLLERLKKKMKKEVEDIYDHLINQELPIEGIFAPYFLTLFLYSTPVNIAEKIIDWFLYKGEDFILEMIIKMLKMKQNKILKFKWDHPPSYELQIYLSKEMVEECCADASIKSILGHSQLSDRDNFFML